jgi:NitT/TauT family transport system substrate-binding protein
VLSAGLVTVLVAACGSGSGPRGAPPELTNLTVAAVPVADDAGLYIAQDKGLFKQAGLTVTIDPIVSSALSTAGQNSGKYDVTAGNSVSFIQDQVTKASNLEIVAEASLMQPGNQALYTLPGSTVTNIAGMKGKRIGVNVLNNIGTLLISSVLQSHGVSPSDVHFVQIPQGFPAMATALEQHTIDVAWLPEPFGSIDQVNFGLIELTDLDQGATANFPVAWYVVTKQWAARYPRTLAAFLGALQKGQQIAGRDRSAVESAMERLAAPYSVPSSIAAVMTLENYPLNVAPHIDVTSVQEVADAMLQVGMLHQSLNMRTMLTP